MVSLLELSFSFLSLFEMFYDSECNVDRVSMYTGCLTSIEYRSIRDYCISYQILLFFCKISEMHCFEDISLFNILNLCTLIFYFHISVIVKYEIHINNVFIFIRVKRHVNKIKNVCIQIQETSALY